jgi:KDO2-lipid IV(A) lauroyltransferase
MAKPRNDFVDRLQYVGLRIVHMMMHCWPIHANLRVAQLIGDFVYLVDKRHRERARKNISRCFPELTEKQVDEAARESIQQMFMLFVEVLFTIRLIRIDTFTRHVRLGNFRETLDLLMRRHGGLLMLTGHYGNWEILGYVIALLGFPTLSVARSLDNKYVNQWLLGVRERVGQKIVHKKGVIDIVMETLKKEGTVGIIADQDAGKKGLFVDFFGRKASTYKSIGLLAMEFNVPIVIGYARRLGNRYNFEIGTSDIIYPKDWADQDNPLHYITQRYTTAIETFIRDAPGQYLWVHRRWKTRPKGEPPENYD